MLCYPHFSLLLDSLFCLHVGVYCLPFATVLSFVLVLTLKGQKPPTSSIDRNWRSHRFYANGNDEDVFDEVDVDTII